ncbi:hypothetical protein ACFSM7_07160 [Clavibacter michiganensis subsp. tessellarius]
MREWRIPRGHPAAPPRADRPPVGSFTIAPPAPREGAHREGCPSGRWSQS